MIRYSIFLLFLIKLAYTNDEYEDSSVVNLEHSLDDGPALRFTPKGIITIRSINNNIAHFSGDKPFTQDEHSQFLKLAENHGLYRIRVPIKVDKGEEYVETALQACQLISSRLHMHLVVSVDGSGGVVGIHASSPVAHCQREKNSTDDRWQGQQMTLKTTVDIQSPAIGATPDTMEYLKRVEKQREEKAKSEQGDNRSFFAKYWMYIVPLVFILMMASSAADPNAGGGR